MTDYLNSALDGLVPDFADERGDWHAVVRDAGVRQPTASRGALRPLRRRRALILVFAVIAIVVPLAAVAASQEWWLFRFGSSPTPITDVIVLRDGWGGQDWQLVAYLSSTDGICFGISAGSGAELQPAAMRCEQIEGVPRTSESKVYTPHGITYLGGSPEGFPTYVAGPVVEAATEVVVVLTDGTEVRAPTFDVPDELGAIRFFATVLPDAPRNTEPPPRSPIQKLIGFDRDGGVVACLPVLMPDEGASLAACR